MLGYVVTVTLRGWEERQFYIGAAPWPMVLDLAERIVATENGMRAIIRSIKAKDEAEFWYLCGLRGLKVQPSLKYADSYKLGMDRNMATNAISRWGDGKTVSARLDEFQCDGVFLYDGTVVRGTLGSMPKEEMAFRIWAQMQDIKLSDKQLREMWKKKQE
jgi:hypothetical protein